jgi:DNA-binding NtrC family response regulator
MPPKLILVVDNDINLRQSIALILQRAGYLVTTTECVYKALDLIQSRKYQLIISDLHMPETSQVLLPKALSIYPYLSVVVLTDRPLSGAERETELLSAHYLVKPIAPERLLDCVGTILGRQRNFNHNEKSNLPINHN